VTEEHIPNAVKKAKPSSSTVFPVRFFPLDKKVEFAWANVKTGDVQDILTKEAIGAFNANPKKISKACIEAYTLILTWLMVGIKLLGRLWILIV
jgi:hypothetical protein